MSSSSDDDDEDILDLVNLANIQIARRRRFWVHPMWLEKWKTGGAFNVMQELNLYPDRFQNFYRMSQGCYFTILGLVKDDLQKKHTHWREPVSPEERLLITLRYFATGSSFKALSFYFLKGHSTIQEIVHHTAKVIWKKLQPVYMPKPSAAKWKEIAQRYYDLWNMPNCIGSIDGKHIRIKAPPRSGSTFINYKGFFSVVLLAVSDSDGLFVTIDVGELGRNNLNLPEPALPGETQKIPYFFIGDEAFPLSQNLIRPFSRKELINNEQRIFNTRFSRARKSVECSFGILATKFEILNTLIRCNPSKVDIIVQALCVLHNAIREYDGTFSRPQYENVVTDTAPINLPTNNPKNVRIYLSKYFKHRIPHQDRYCVDI